MNTLDRYLIRQFIPVFLGGLILFVFLVELIDLFANIFKYLNQDASALDIIKVSFFYLPKAVSYSLPISLLFASSFVLGDLYSRNELIVVFSSGIPLFRFSFTMIVIGFLFSIGSFYFEDRVVIKTLTFKNELSRVLLKQEKKGAESDIVVKSEGGRLLYITEYFDIANTILVNITIVERDSNGNFLSMTRSKKAIWDGEKWDLEQARHYRWEDNMLVFYPKTPEYDYTESPERFARNMKEVDELRASDAKLYVQDLKEAGLSSNSALTDYYKRFSFSVTPIVVILLSIALGGQFRKNILLMSLLSSLIAAVLYYVIQMITVMLAKLGYIIPVSGAWFPSVLFFFIVWYLFSKART